MRTGGFFRTFRICALFAGLSIVVGGVRVGTRPRDVILGAVATGLFTGLFMTVWLGMMRHTLSRFADRLAPLLNPGAQSDQDVRERITLPVPPDRALALCRAAMERVPGVHGVRAGGASVHGMTGVRWMGIGQRIECHVAATEGGSAVEICALPQYRLIGAGHHERRAHVQRIHAYLLDHATAPALSAGSPPEAEAPLYPRERVRTGLHPS